MIPREKVTHCAQPGCGAQMVWGLTVRQWDQAKGQMRGGRPHTVDWPFPSDDHTGPTPNLGVRRDDHGTLQVRVLTADDPLRANEALAVSHWATCKNPPPKKTTRATSRRPPAPIPAPPGQQDLFTEPEIPAPPGLLAGALSDARLFPRRRTRQG